jgi:hypothetical protein
MPTCWIAELLATEGGLNTFSSVSTHDDMLVVDLDGLTT